MVKKYNGSVRHCEPVAAETLELACRQRSRTVLHVTEIELRHDDLARRHVTSGMFTDYLLGKGLSHQRLFPPDTRTERTGLLGTDYICRTVSRQVG